MEPIERVVLVHRLREVVAQVGFTRFESAAPDIEGELDIGVRRASLAREVSWLPAFENKGEGIFLQFKSKAISDWLQRAEVQARSTKLGTGFEEWQKGTSGNNSRVSRAGLPDAALFFPSADHSAIAELRLSSEFDSRTRLRDPECRVRRSALHRNLRRGRNAGRTGPGGTQNPRDGQSALDLGMLCSNDPVCAQHDPASRHERRFLHGAACHGCVLISETSCEQQNDFLDRALVVPTVQDLGGQFFSEIMTSEGSASVVGTV